MLCLTESDDVMPVQTFFDTWLETCHTAAEKRRRTGWRCCIPLTGATPSTLREESRSNSAARSILRCCSQVWTGSPYRRRNPSLNVVAERQARRLKVDMERGSSRLSSIYRRVSAKVRIIS